jgi:hypothetical protein
VFAESTENDHWPALAEDQPKLCLTHECIIRGKLWVRIYGVNRHSQDPAELELMATLVRDLECLEDFGLDCAFDRVRIVGRGLVTGRCRLACRHRRHLCR